MLAPELPKLPPAQQRYQAFARIGRGGMAEVFLAVARRTAVKKLVVLKRMWPDLAADPAFAEMFLDEARLSTRMSHPNVVQTYDVFEEGGRLTLAMEYLDGQPLTRVLNRLSTAGAIGDLSLAQRLRIVADILAGLDHVHELTDYDGQPLGVVHRDVSPHNVFITYDGHVKLMDFGVAKTCADSHLTRPGTIKGKLAYMAPDQMRATEVDRRADIFSVGVILWEMLSGRRMWSGRTEVSIVRHLSYGLPLPRLREELSLPAGVADVCYRALAFTPAEQFTTAAEMEVELRRLLPTVADSYPRDLGKIVSLAFAAERGERQAMIDRCLSAEDLAPNTDEMAHEEFLLDESATSGEGQTEFDIAPSARALALLSGPPGGAEDVARTTRSGTFFWNLTAGAVAALFVAGAVLLASAQRNPASRSAEAQRPRTTGVGIPSVVEPMSRSATVALVAPLSPTNPPGEVVMPMVVPPVVPGDERVAEQLPIRGDRPRRRRSNRWWARDAAAGRAWDEDSFSNRATRTGENLGSQWETGASVDRRPAIRRREIDTVSPFLP